MTNFPTAIDEFETMDGDKTLAEVGHANYHNTERSAISALEKKVGIDSSADTDSIDYLLDNARTRLTVAESDIDDLEGALPTGDIVGTTDEQTLSNKTLSSPVFSAGAISFADIATKIRAGWDLLSATGTRVSNTQMTIAGDITDRLWVGKPVEFTDTTTKYGNIVSFSYSSPNTTINLAANTNYALVGNPTNIYGGLHASPVGFPHAFATAIGFVRFEGGTMIQYGSLAITCVSGSDNVAGTLNFPAGLNFADTKYTFTHSGANSTNFATVNEMPLSCHSTHTEAQAVITLFPRAGTWAANRNTTVKWRAEGKI